MNRGKFLNSRRLSLAGFSFLSAYILSFAFEGQVLYSLLDQHGLKAEAYILVAIMAHFLGLISCGIFVRSQAAAKSIMLGGLGLCLAATIPFFFSQPLLWMGGLIVSGYSSGCAVAAWGYFLRAFTPKNQRIKSCAHVLIYSNLLMIGVNVFAMNWSAFLGLALSILYLLMGMVFIWMLPVEKEKEEEVFINKRPGVIKKSLIMLCLFIFIITINSGLMYQVINPAFGHLTRLTSWYWALPYIVALAIIGNSPMKTKRPIILYIGMVMIVGAFISFMVLGRNAWDYLIVDTLMLGACGIFDLFWWSILGEMLDYTNNPSLTFGIGLSANVLGVLAGDLLGIFVASIGFSGAELAVIALAVVCLTLVILPLLNHQLVLLLKSHAYLTVYDKMSHLEQRDIISQVKTLGPLTGREEEVLQLILFGKSNREIGGDLFISENTVKTHARNIFSKYNVSSRVELMSILLKNQSSQ